jgi:hypothetical protein
MAMTVQPSLVMEIVRPLCAHPDVKLRTIHIATVKYFLIIHLSVGFEYDVTLPAKLPPNRRREILWAIILIEDHEYLMLEPGFAKSIAALQTPVRTKSQYPAPNLWIRARQRGPSRQRPKGKGQLKEPLSTPCRRFSWLPARPKRPGY